MQRAVLILAAFVVTVLCSSISAAADKLLTAEEMKQIKGGHERLDYFLCIDTGKVCCEAACEPWGGNY